MPKIPQEKKEQTDGLLMFANHSPRTLANKLKALGAETQMEQTPPHLMIRAYAGSGKTSTLVEGLRLLVEGQTSFMPSPQQEAVWAELLKSEGIAKTFCMTSFGNEIVKTLEKRIPKHSSCVAKTLHGIGLKAIYDSYGKRFEPDQYRTGKILSNLKGISYDQLRQNHEELADNVTELVHFCKMNALQSPFGKGELEWVIRQSDLDIDPSLDIILAVDGVLKQSCRAIDSIDFDDMIWLPVVNNLILPSFDILFVDECQDLNVCQQRLALRLGKRLVFVGDENQACYAFAGADANSWQNLHKSLQETSAGCIDLPLSVSFRCSQEVIKDAQVWVGGIEPCLKNPQGSVNDCTQQDLDSCAKSGDLVICRNNAPLISQCLKFLAAGKKAYIRGRKNIAKGLVRLVDKIIRMCARNPSVNDFFVQLMAWRDGEVVKANTQIPPDERQRDYVKDRAACLEYLSRNVPSVKALRDKIYAIFEDKTSNGIQLSTIHQAKGIEAKRVFFIMTKGNECPTQWAKTSIQQTQERNLRYIGITRAISDLIYVY